MPVLAALAPQPVVGALTSNAFTEITRELPESWKIGFKLISDGSSTLRREFGA